MYRVVKFFTDLQDGDHPYHVGDSFPRDGVEVTEDRIKELSGKYNRQGVPLIEYEDEKNQEALAQEMESVEVERENDTGENKTGIEHEEVPEPAKRSVSRKGRRKVSAEE